MTCLYVFFVLVVLCLFVFLFVMSLSFSFFCGGGGSFVVVSNHVRSVAWLANDSSGVGRCEPAQIRGFSVQLLCFGLPPVSW